MRPLFSLLGLGSLLLLQPMTTYAQEADCVPAEPPPDVRELIDHQATPTVRLGAGNRQSLGQLAVTGTLIPGRAADRDQETPIYGRSEAGSNMMALACQLQALYDIGGASVPSAALTEEIESRSAALAQAVGFLLDFANQATEPPVAEPVSIPEERYGELVLRIVNLYLSLVDPLTESINLESINSDVQDLETLELVRSGLTTMEALVVALPDSEFTVSQSRAPAR
jgi:hypothetical protein